MSAAPAPVTDGFSASDAALDGFRVIRTHWRLIVGWAAFNVLALVALVAVTVIVLLVLSASGATQAAGAMGGVLGLLGVVTIEVMIISALYRTLLRDEQPGFLHLRLGKDELRLVAAALVLWIGLLGMAGLSWWLTALVQRQAGTPPAAVAGVVALVIVVWLGVRFSLTLPATFADRRLQFAQSWRLTRGRVLPLLGMYALVICVLALVAVVAWFALYLLVGSVSGFQDLGMLSLSDGTAFAERPGAYLVQMAGEVLVGPLLLAIGQAPLAAAYRALARG